MAEQWPPPVKGLVLVAGSTGQLAQGLKNLTWPRTAEPVFLGRSELDITDPSQVSKLVQQLRPALIINAAAYTAVDLAESEPELAQAVNHHGVEHLTKAAAALSANLITVSTDYVFDGTSKRPYEENDLPNPMGVYGATKLAGEHAALSYERSLVVRTAWVYSAWGSNFVKTMLRLGAERDEISVVDDQIGCPTSAADLAGCILGLAGIVQNDDRLASGIVHAAAPDWASWYDLAEQIFSYLEMSNPLSLKAISSDLYPAVASRPANSRLSTKRLVNEYGLCLQPWREALKVVLDELGPRGTSGDSIPLRKVKTSGR